MAGSADVLVRMTCRILAIRPASGSHFALIADEDVRAPSKLTHYSLLECL